MDVASDMILLERLNFNNVINMSWSFMCNTSEPLFIIQCETCVKDASSAAYFQADSGGSDVEFDRLDMETRSELSSQSFKPQWTRTRLYSPCISAAKHVHSSAYQTPEPGRAAHYYYKEPTFQTIIS